MSLKKAHYTARGYTPPLGVQTHTHNILVACGLIVIPMIIFTVVALAFVFANTVRNQGCSFDDLCSTTGLMNATSKAYYYVDFSATSLVFISSWSSTVSFALVGVLMSMYAYSVAAHLLPGSGSQTGDSVSPYQLSLMIRVLNAEILSLWNLIQPTGRKTLRRAKSLEDHQPVRPHVLRRSAVVFGLALFGCICIQAADTYLHLATKSVDMLHVIPQQPEQQHLSRRIGEWCFNTETFGTQANINFWSCALYFNETATVTAPANATQFHRIIGEPLEDYVLNYTEKDGTQYAIIGPSKVSQQIDWEASSFAVTSECSVIPQSGCAITQGTSIFGFDCREEKGSSLDFQGNMTDGYYSLNFGKFHRYLEEQPPFISQSLMGWKNVPKLASQLTDDDAQRLWNNPWPWMAEVSLLADEKDLPPDVLNVAWLLDGLGYKMVVNCSSTVYDVTYKSVGGKVTSLHKTLSNGTTTGIAIMPLVETLGFSRSLHDSAMHRASQAVSVQSWLRTFELEISKSFTVPLAVHTVSHNSIRAQKRISKVIARVPVASLWLLVLANLSFAGLAIVIAGIALRAARGGEVHQLCLRLGVSGFVATLFEPGVEDKVVDSESDLFQENEEGWADHTAVSIEKTSMGGVAWLTARKGRHAASSDSQVSGFAAQGDVGLGRTEYAQQSIITRGSDTSMRHTTLTVAGRGEFSRPLLEDQRR